MNYGKGNMNKLVKSNPKSIIQWDSGAGEYQVICPRCRDELFAPTLNTIKRNFRLHYKTEKCEAHY